MTGKIFRNSLFVGMIVLLLCGGIFCGVMYGHVKELVYSELRVEAVYVETGIETMGEEYLDSLDTSRRVTIVDADGTVVYDNRADIMSMENHIDRNEISDALAFGNGQSMHFSGTMMETTLYYACLMADGRVLRLSAPHESIFSMLSEIIQPLIAAVLIVFIICALISFRLSRQITAPINAIDLQTPDKKLTYPELEPLVNRVMEQNRTIRTQMDELGRKQREFETITENMSEGLILVDNRSNVIFANRFALEAIGSNELKHISRSRCSESLCESVEAALSGESSEKIVPDGERLLQMICSPVVSNGHVSGAVLLILDVTEREKREELRREFSANVSHELKTPLTSISGFAELMKEGLVPPEKMREFSADIYSESRRLISLVEDIMRLSRLEEGCEPERESIELCSLAKSVTDTLRSFADASDVSISVDGEEASVFGSRRVLSEMLHNLCENAIKYNKPGGKVLVDISRGEEETRLSVRDTGIGIPKNHQNRIFERFYRVDKSHSKAIGGTGLGLSIVRHGAKFHNASIELSSEEGVGSEFTIIFPDKGE